MKEQDGTFTPSADLNITGAYLVLNYEQYYNIKVNISVENEAVLLTTAFDIHATFTSSNENDWKSQLTQTQELSKNGVIARYQYSFNKDSIFRLYADGTLANLGAFNGRKITAIGFSNNWIGGGNYQNAKKVLAVLDTSNYDFRINSSEVLDITRVDSLSSDSQCFTKLNEIKGPIHLAPLRYA